MTAEAVSDRIGVGIIGSGPVTQAIHLPTLARLADVFRVVRVMDVDPEVAAGVAARVGSAWTTDVDELLADPAVEVVAICSPHRFHAEQVIAACRAGKRAILCEKPFATSGEEAEGIAAVSEETGVPIVVGAMHAYDEGWRAAAATGVVPRVIRSSIVLPPNPRFEDFATEVIARPPWPAFDMDDPDAVAAAIEGNVLGLAIHDLPLIRQLLERAAPGSWRDVRVLTAELVSPGGYLIVLDAAGVTVELHAQMGVAWDPQWRLDVDGEDADGEPIAVDVLFSPSYVQAGSAETTVSAGGIRTVRTPAAANGYEGEWRRIAAVVREGGEGPSASGLIDDVVFALDIAEAAAGLARAGAVARAEAVA